MNQAVFDTSFFKSIAISMGTTAPIDSFTQIAGIGSLLFVSYHDFKQAMLGRQADPGYYDKHGHFISVDRAPEHKWFPMVTDPAIQVATA